MKQQEIINVLRWAVVADALGVPAEMRPRGTYPKIMDMQASSFWRQPAGSWSDDTSMTLCLIENLVEAQPGDYSDLMQRFESYMRYGTNTPQGEIFDIGRTCAHAIRNFAVNRQAPLLCGDGSPYANGNGALMRIAPLAILLQSETDRVKRFNVARDYTVVTHRHARAVVGSYLFLELLHHLLNHKSLKQALNIVRASCEAGWLAPVYQNEISQYQMIFETAFPQTSEKMIKTSGYVVDTLAAAVWVALTQSTPRQGIITAVNLGGDTDTVATVAASLLAAGNLQTPVDTQWWHQTLNHQILDNHFETFAKNMVSS